MEELKTFKAEQGVKMIQMEQKLVAAEMEIQRLKYRYLMLESLSNHSVEHANGKTLEPSKELQLDPIESIFLVGGYDGESWLSALKSYFPSQYVIKSVQPMSSIRSYVSAALLNGAAAATGNEVAKPSFMKLKVVDELILQVLSRQIKGGIQSSYDAIHVLLNLMIIESLLLKFMVMHEDLRKLELLEFLWNHFMRGLVRLVLLPQA